MDSEYMTFPGIPGRFNRSRLETAWLVLQDHPGTHLRDVARILRDEHRWVSINDALPYLNVAAQWNGKG